MNKRHSPFFCFLFLLKLLSLSLPGSSTPLLVNLHETLLLSHHHHHHHHHQEGQKHVTAIFRDNNRPYRQPLSDVVFLSADNGRSSNNMNNIWSSVVAPRKETVSFLIPRGGGGGVGVGDGETTTASSTKDETTTTLSNEATTTTTILTPLTKISTIPLVASKVANWIGQTSQRCWTVLLVAILMDIRATTLTKEANDSSTDPTKKMMLALSCYVCAVLLFGASLSKIDVSVAYAVWSGLGTSMVTLAGILLYGEKYDARKLICLSLIIGGVVGLNLVDDGH